MLSLGEKPSYPWELQTQSWSEHLINLFPLIGTKSLQLPRVGWREKSSRTLLAREIEFPKQEHRWFLSRVKMS